MAELKNGKFVFDETEQAAFDKLVADRVSRETKKIDALKLQLESALQDKANIESEKDKVEAELAKTIKTHAETEAKLKNAGIEFDNLKNFTKDYQAQKEQLKKYQDAELLLIRKTAFVEAGGDEKKFDKAIKLVEFKEDSDAKTIFTDLLKDDSWAILRSKTTGDPNSGGEKPGEPTGEDPEKVASQEWAKLIFSKKDK